MNDVAPVKLVGISGSLRQGSYNSALLRAAAELLPAGMTLEIATLAELPFYNADVEQQGLPPIVQDFRARIAAGDAVLVAAPEYNFSIPGVLKNALEWLSRPPHPPMSGKACAVMGATVSPLGTARGQFHLRHVCVSLNAFVLNAPHVDITDAKTKFDATGRLLDQASRDAITKLLSEVGVFARRLRNA
jgi:chromate reductase